MECSCECMRRCAGCSCCRGMSAVSVADLGDDVLLSSLLTREDRSILLPGGLAQACKRVLIESTQQIKRRAQRLSRARHQLYLQQCEDHTQTVVYPVEFRSRGWCVDFAIARETRDFAVRHGHLTQHDAHAITLAHANPGTPVQAPSGHKIVHPTSSVRLHRCTCTPSVSTEGCARHRGSLKGFAVACAEARSRTTAAAGPLDGGAGFHGCLWCA